MAGIYLILYVIGSVLAYGLYTGAMYTLEEKHIDTVKPSYKVAHDDKLGYIMAFLSWFGVIAVLIGVAINTGDKPRIKYSYKNLWKRWENTSMQ